MEIWTALAIGFFGSFHCIGMCGPIAMALPGNRSSTASLIAGRLLYNSGRVITYSLLGMVFGLIGHSVIIAGFQELLSVALGIAIIAGAIGSSGYLSDLEHSFGLDKLFRRLKDLISRQFKKRGMATLLTIGLLNGLLPCGFVYVGLAGSATTGSLTGGALYMALFGLGTFPAMMAMSLAPNFISLESRRRINRYIPLLAILLGIYLVYRGLMMGVPY